MNLLTVGTIVECAYVKATDQTLFHTPGTDIPTFNFSDSWYTVETYGDFNRTTQIAHASYNHQRHSFIRYRHDGEWSSWREIVCVESPQIFDLPLTESLAPYVPCTYSKDQFGMVLLNINAKTTDHQDTLNGRTIIATLPEGYRPKNTCVVSAFARKHNNSKAYVTDTYIAEDGVVTCDIFAGDDAAGIIHFQCLFATGIIQPETIG